MLLRINDLAIDQPELRKMAESLSDRYEASFCDAEDRAERPAGIHASEISGCPRKNLYTMIGTEKKNKPAPMWRKKFKIGHAIHRMVQNEMHELARRSNGLIAFQDEVPISPYTSSIAQEFGIYSSCDGIITMRTRGQDGNLVDLVRVGLEIKSASPAEYEKMNSPKEAHSEQCQVYMACLDIPLFWVMYYNKGNEGFTPSRGSFLTTFQHHLWDKLATRFSHWLELKEAGQLPDREEGLPCEWCPYLWTCEPAYRRRAPKRDITETVTVRNRYARRVQDGD